MEETQARLVYLLTSQPTERRYFPFALHNILSVDPAALRARNPLVAGGREVGPNDALG
jgi:hypothetical protein